MAYVQVYTGDGKGKTTAALGLALRALGAGLRVKIIQFLKKGDYSEIAALRGRFPEAEIEQRGSGRFIDPAAIPADDLACAAEALRDARRDAASGEYDLLILDELNGAMSMGLADERGVLALLDARSPRTEIVLTGRGCPEAVLASADLVTEMRLVKHYYQQGVEARRGIEF